MAKPFPGTLTTALLCEDVRTELGNKHTIVGVFSNDILVASLPAVLSLSAYLEYVPDEIGVQNITLSIVVAGNVVANIEAKLSVVEAKTVSVLYLPRVNLTVPRAAEIRLDMKVFPGEPTTIIKKQVLTSPDVIGAIVSNETRPPSSRSVFVGSEKASEP